MEQNIIFNLKEKLVPVFLKNKRIAAVYLFGSLAEGSANEQSDIDLAVLFVPHTKLGLYDFLSLEVEAGDVLKTENYDILNANEAPLVLQFRIISQGILIYNVYDDIRSDFEEITMQQYYDFSARLLEFNREYFMQLKESYL